MRYLALACDYDGTLATEGRVPPETVQALERLQGVGPSAPSGHRPGAGRASRRLSARLPLRPCGRRDGAVLYDPSAGGHAAQRTATGRIHPDPFSPAAWRRSRADG